VASGSPGPPVADDKPILPESGVGTHSVTVHRSPWLRRRLLRLILAGVIAWFAAVVTLWSAGSLLADFGATGSPTGGVEASSRGDAAEDVRAGLTRWPRGQRPVLPTVSGRTLDGGRLDLADLHGRVLVINTWGSWCAPCREEAPHLQRAWDATRSQRVQFLGINVRDGQAPARSFVREFGITYPSLVDQDLELVLALSPTISAQAIPTTIVVDRHGHVAARVMGKISYETLHALVLDVLAE
jgi:peroxiredoxin